MTRPHCRLIPSPPADVEIRIFAPFSSQNRFDRFDFLIERSALYCRDRRAAKNLGEFDSEKFQRLAVLREDDKTFVFIYLRENAK